MFTWTCESACKKSGRCSAVFKYKKEVTTQRIQVLPMSEHLVSEDGDTEYMPRW